MASREERGEVAPHHVRGEERDREALQDAEGKDEEVLQQPALGEPREPGVVHEPLHGVVQPPEEASGTRE